MVYSPNPFASSIVSYSPGDGAGFGQDGLPDIVLGPPVGGGEMSGSLDVLTLGHQGEIILAFDMTIVDGEGPDLIVFENPFIGWYETAVVSASEDGENWLSWPCESQNSDEGYPGCAGVSPTLSHPDNCIDATDPNVAGGDYFDLAELGLQRANFIRIQDSGDNTDGGFDLDAVSIVNGSID
ncbi:MAG: cell surface protein [Proteobacteria bacterium]|nr:cell surface protein [Pseudomonadota bacterium]